MKPEMGQQAVTDKITFLGTGGARFMVSRQLAASGGLWLDLGGTCLLVDPGPGCIVQVTKRKLDPETLSGIIVSHRHLDHAADVNVMVEAMTAGGFNPHGRIYAPADAFGPEPVMYSYLKKTIDGITLLEEGGSYTMGDVAFETPIRHQHGAETYGMKFRTPRHTFSYVADSRFFDGLYSYGGSDLLIINVVFTEPQPRFDHLSIPEVETLVRELKPKVALLSHYGIHVWRADPSRLAGELTQRTGIKVVAARDGMAFDLAQLDDGDGNTEKVYG